MKVVEDCDEFFEMMNRYLLFINNCSEYDVLEIDYLWWSF